MVNINFLQVKQIIEIGLKNRRKEEMGYGMDDGLTELELAGLNPEELGYMTGVERRRILEDAGLNPDEYDF